jgi:hypothetical protein
MSQSHCQSWIGRAQFLVEGVIHEYDPDEPEYQEWTKVKHVSNERILATFDGCWQKRLYWKRVGDSVGLCERCLVCLTRMHTPIDQTHVDRLISFASCPKGGTPHWGPDAIRVQEALGECYECVPQSSIHSLCSLVTLFGPFFSSICR